MNREKEIALEEKRTSVNIALSSEDKVFLKVYAAQHNTSVAAVIHDCIKKLRKEVPKRG
ncbi:hypothetical protein [Anaerotignum lactatifermentans]|uniref:CopG family transcriptional regulator n=1 Tax=Anaerotignum lactatifermentans DSM 14214 TaxID=1121323 RepID=A0A1M6N6N4_9FIRM|nr:hypothetical protein [Anaerotignum lactatifermentans]SHJ91369.1 hypothetical protein SAMN02745138_00784 [[Clostridium] lactatifermentans DSM 14214] [Anaerotignum lactatifermentans DSM 14214]